MATNTGVRGDTARQLALQVVHTLRKKVNWNDTNIGTADSANSLVGYLPQGAFITGVWVEVTTAFNAGTTNVLTVGSNAGSDNNIVASGDVNAAVTGVTQVTRGYGRSLANAGDLKVYALYTQTGAAATAGAAQIVIEYVVDNDR